MKFSQQAWLLLQICGSVALAGELPPRTADAPPGSTFAQSLAGFTLSERELEIARQFAAGNVPAFWRKFVEVKVTRQIEGQEHSAVYRVAPEYLAIGADADFFLAPVTPGTAEMLAGILDCTLPTPRMVDDIHAAATVKLTPAPLPPGPAMTSVAVFIEHNGIVQAQRARDAQPPGALVSGHKKDLVQTPRLASAPGKVAIYGWHRADGSAIQPLYLGHTSAWVDYSHGARFVQRALTVDGRPTTIEAVLADARLAALLSGSSAGAPPVESPAGASPADPAHSGRGARRTLAGEAPALLERLTELTFDPGVRAVINEPAVLRPEKPLRLVLYAAPAGNTIEQTFGRRLQPGDDWHFYIQHLAAQTRWLRQNADDADLVVVCLQCAQKSWPAWRKQADPENRRIPPIVEALRERFAGRDVRLVLSGHSAGGSFVFGFIDALAEIPASIERIAFLDSNFAYSAAKNPHTKLAAWLQGDAARHLCVLAYHDSIALLDGKTFVSEEGGTWGRSHAMQRDLAALFSWKEETAGDLRRVLALEGRAQFLLLENPARVVLHTRLVEWNGFIHSMLTGTEREEKGYRYLGARAYAGFIAP